MNILKVKRVLHALICSMFLIPTTVFSAPPLIDSTVEIKLVPPKGVQAHVVPCSAGIPTLILFPIANFSTPLTIQYVSGGTATNIKSNLPQSDLPFVSEIQNTCATLSASSPTCTITFQAGTSATGVAEVTISGTNMNSALLCIAVS